MTSPRPPLRTALSRFRRAEEGSLSVEAILTVPILFAALVFIYCYFAAFEVQARANKAAYTLVDYVTRQTDDITPDFITGLAKIYSFLNNDGDVSVRVTTVRWVVGDNNEGQYELQWSAARGDDFSALTEDNLSVIKPRLPIMSAGNEVVVVETLRHWTAPLKVALNDVPYYDIIVSMPRFSTKVGYDPDA